MRLVSRVIIWSLSCEFRSTRVYHSENWVNCMAMSCFHHSLFALALYKFFETCCWESRQRISNVTIRETETLPLPQLISSQIPWAASPCYNFIFNISNSLEPIQEPSSDSSYFMDSFDAPASSECLDYRTHSAVSSNPQPID